MTTNRHLMIASAIIALVLGLCRLALQSPGAILIVEITWLAGPILASIGLGLLRPEAAGSWLFAATAALFPISAYHFFRYTISQGPVANEWLLLGLTGPIKTRAPERSLDFVLRYN